MIEIERYCGIEMNWKK